MLYMEVMGRAEGGLPVVEERREGRWGVAVALGGDMMPFMEEVGGCSE